MYRMRESWTDERLDDFRDEVNRRFDRVEGDIRDMRTEMSDRFDDVNGRFNDVNGRFERMNGRFDDVNGRFDALQRTLLQIAAATIATLIVGFTGLIVTQL